ncbi:MAG: ABC transporter permease [Sulfitobacter sp.]
MADASSTYHPAPAMEPKKQGRRLRTITALVLREMQAQYGSSPGGYAWAILDPVGKLAIMAVLFSFVVRAPSLGTNFILFYATGFLPFTLFNALTGVTTNALTYSRSLLTYPVVMWIDAIAARVLLTVLTNMVVAYLIMLGILNLYETGASLHFLPIFVAYSGAIMMGIGVGLVNAVLIGFFPVWQTIWSILTRPLFLISGVLMILEDLPRNAQEYLAWNPLIHLTGSMREGFYPLYKPQYISYTYVYLTALLLIAIGILLMRRFHRQFLKK